MSDSPHYSYQPDPFKVTTPELVFQDGLHARITNMGIFQGAFKIIAQTVGPVAPGRGWVAIVGDEGQVVGYADDQEWSGAMFGAPWSFNLSISFAKEDGSSPQPRWTDDGQIVGNIVFGEEGLGG